MAQEDHNLVRANRSTTYGEREVTHIDLLLLGNGWRFLHDIRLSTPGGRLAKLTRRAT